MKLPNIKILDEKDSRLKTVSKEVEFPLTKEDLKLIDDALLYLEMSQIEEQREKYHLRAGMGLSFIQLGIPKRIFVISEELEDNKFKRYVIINPIVKSKSEELVYVAEGEGCLSVNRPVEGIVPRHARITIEAYNEDGELYTIRVREDMAIAFQHELDHLDGILFFDHIDPKKPFKNRESMREIWTNISFFIVK